jgi:hypothetical protein
MAVGGLPVRLTRRECEALNFWSGFAVAGLECEETRSEALSSSEG